jgi:hypothetical protein
MGMASEPGQCSSLASRLICAKCGVSPRIKNPELIKAGDSSFTVTAMCHGQEETKFIERSKLVFTQRFFEDSESEQDL